MFDKTCFPDEAVDTDTEGKLADVYHYIYIRYKQVHTD
jgi:hypothetical protein